MRQSILGKRCRLPVGLDGGGDGLTATGDILFVHPPFLKPSQGRGWLLEFLKIDLTLPNEAVHSSDMPLESASLIAKIVQKKNGAVTAIGVIFILVTIVLALRVGDRIYKSTSGADRESLMASAKFSDTISRSGLSIFKTSSYEDHVQRLDDANKRAKIEGFIGAGLLIGGIILLSIKSEHCSECGAKVAINTAKLCGSCGAKFDGSTSI